MKRLWILLLLLAFAGCNQQPSSDGSSTENTTKEQVVDTTDAGKIDSRTPSDIDSDNPDTKTDKVVKETSPDEQPPACKSDCDCRKWKAGYACENNVCAAVDRAVDCPRCASPQCIDGKACLGSDGKIGKCPDKISCKHDCDCWLAGTSRLCDSNTGFCEALKRKSFCMECTSDSCKEGEPCISSTTPRKVGKCGAPKTCKHDCDCVKDGKVCHEGKCAPLKRMSLCVSCSASCGFGEPCLEKDGSIGKCTQKSCKHDCDCDSIGKNCDNGQCTNSRRMSLCLSCDGKCQKGQPCKKKTGGYGTCGSSSTSCKNDCECTGLGEVCESGQCKASTRDSKCLRCTDINCKKGDPCKQLDGTVSTCKGSTCCTVVGCPSGRICCPGGVKPPPGVCGHTCDAPGPNGGCIPKP